MDDYDVERPELTGTYISMEFGAGGRIHQLWSSDPNPAEEGDDFQFVLQAVQFGEEFAEDYYPGTVLIGARTQPDEPWILSRNTDATVTGDEYDISSVSFSYEFSLLPEIQATGRFYEVPGPPPQVVWDVKLTNGGRVSMEIGEIGFPMAFNNFYEGFSRTDKGINNLWSDRVYIHPYIGGAASHLFVQRLNAESPGLLVFPGDDTGWEFYASVRASLNTPYRWEGIPIVYALSRAAMEREGWGKWNNDHTSIILEPGDSRTFQTRFVPASRCRFDEVAEVLSACGRPNFKVHPSAVAPAEVGIALEVSGATPARFFVDREAETETDSDENGGFCWVRPKEAGPLRVTIEDTKGRQSHAHLLLTEPIDKLIQARADWIVENQVHLEPGSAFDRAIVPVDLTTGEQLVGQPQIANPFIVESGLADALFLAEKNTIYPVREEIEVLDACIAEFIRHDLQNPANDSVGSWFMDSQAVSWDYGRPQVYALVFNLYLAMSRVAATFGETKHKPATYLKWAYRTAAAMFRSSLTRASRDHGLPLLAHIWDLIDALREKKLAAEADALIALANQRVAELCKREYPFSDEPAWDTAGFAEVFAAARHGNSENLLDSTVRHAYAARSLAPSWWWYGSDRRLWDDYDGIPHPAISDKGALCGGYSTAANSRMYFDLLDRDYNRLHDAHLRQAFGGAMACWGMVRANGMASMGYCSDSASKMFGHNRLTGDIGVALFEYLQMAGSYVLPNRHDGVYTFGCFFGADDGNYHVRPWDGVGRKVVLRQIGAKVTTSFGRILELRMDSRKRRLSVNLENPSAKDMKAEVGIEGLWGVTVESNGRRFRSVDGEVAVPVALPARGRIVVQVRVIE